MVEIYVIVAFVAGGVLGFFIGRHHERKQQESRTAGLSRDGSNQQVR